MARRHLPPKIADKKKSGFGVPVDRWVDGDFKTRLRELLLGSDLPLQNYFRRETYEPVVTAFCENTPHPAISRGGLYERVIMLLSLALALRRC
ncbi:MAG: hypothetical protein DME23_09295 [Verrucomicrobia bacterium]|nr:MAG: hypothetical protein DME23_09295 [Verrucomicrobiota bacterium]